MEEAEMCEKTGTIRKYRTDSFHSFSKYLCVCSSHSYQLTLPYQTKQPFRFSFRLIAIMAHLSNLSKIHICSAVQVRAAEEEVVEEQKQFNKYKGCSSAQQLSRQSPRALKPPFCPPSFVSISTRSSAPTAFLFSLFAFPCLVVVFYIFYSFNVL